MALLRRTITNLLKKRNFSVISILNQREKLAIFEDESNTSRAMKLYKKKAVEQKKFMDEKLVEYDIGKRHLANMMGEDIDTFTQEDIDDAIAYLLPSSLFQPNSRPCMKHPAEIFPKLKDAQFDDTGRPIHSLFYTGLPAYYQLLQDIAMKARNLDKLFVKQTKVQTPKPGFQYSMEMRKLDLDATHWINKGKFSDFVSERISDKNYDFFITSLNRLAAHQLSFREETFLFKFREKDINMTEDSDIIQELMYTSSGIPYMTHSLRVRKADASVTVYGKGSGKITINGDDITFFESHQEREQVIFPLQFTGMLSQVDVVATSKPCEESKHVPDRKRKMGQAYGIRHCLSWSLKPFVEKSMVVKMKMAGLLTHDMRRKERKKPGRMGARRRYTWKKR